MRPTAVVAAASFIVVLALAGCVRMTIAPSPAAVAPPSVAAAAPPATAREPPAVAAPPVAPRGGAPGLTTLRQQDDLLLLKVLSLLQDNDASLASAISASRESIWGILVDPAKFAKLD